MANLTSKQQIAENIRQAQERSNLSDVELAKRSNISPAALSQYRHGHRRPRPETVIAIARGLDCDPIEIDPTLESEFRENSSWFIEASSETRALFVQWSALSNDIQQQRADLTSALKTLQTHCAFIESQIQAQQLEMESVERRLSARLAEMGRRHRILEAIAGYSALPKARRL